jgi:hypothetical protein
MADLLEAAARTSRSVGENARWHVRDEHPPRLPKGVLPAATRVEEASRLS